MAATRRTALLGLFALPDPTLPGVAVTVSLLVGLTMVATLTLLPAMLGFLGPKVLRRAERTRLVQHGRQVEQAGAFWLRWAEALGRRPQIPAVAALAVIGVLALPFLSMRTGSPDASTDPPSWTTYQAYHLLAKGFGPGFNGPLVLVGQVNSPADRARFTAFTAAARSQPGVAGIVPPQLSPDGKAEAAEVYPATGHRTPRPPPFLTGCGRASPGPRRAARWRSFRAFFYGDFSGSPGGQVPSEFAIVRVVEGRAWIERLLVTPVLLEVSVSGSDITGVRVELNSAAYRADARVTGAGQVQLPLPGGLPPNAWLYLSRDKQWLDYRAIGEYARAELQRAGVEIELPDDPEAEIQALLSQGEGQQIEFKRQLPQDTTESKRTVFKTIAAFANGYGGNLVFGIEKYEATVCGLDGIDPLGERDRPAQLVRAIVTPAPEAEVRQYNVDGKVLLVLSVGPGVSRPYGITLPGRKDKPVEFYVWRDATTFPATADEVRNAVLASAPQPATGAA